MADQDTAQLFKPGTFGCHEALDRCSLLADLVDDFSEHEAIKLNPEWKAKAEEASRILNDLYNEICRVHFDGDNAHYKL